MPEQLEILELKLITFFPLAVFNYYYINKAARSFMYSPENLIKTFIACEFMFVYLLHFT